MKRSVGGDSFGAHLSSPDTRRALDTLTRECAEQERRTHDGGGGASPPGTLYLFRGARRPAKAGLRARAFPDKLQELIGVAPDIVRQLERQTEEHLVVHAVRAAPDVEAAIMPFQAYLRRPLSYDSARGFVSVMRAVGDAEAVALLQAACGVEAHAKRRDVG